MQGFYIKDVGFPTIKDKAEEIQRLSNRYGKLLSIYSTFEGIAVIFGY